MGRRHLVVSLALLGACSGDVREAARAVSEASPAASAQVASPAAAAEAPRPAKDLYRSPLYWSVYEYNFLRQLRAGGGVGDPNNLAGRAGENFIPESELRANVDWVEANLKPHGYDMVAIDGWGDTSRLSEHGYRASHSRYWERDYAWWSAHLRARGMRLGMYENPLHVHVARGDTRTKVVGTDIPVDSLVTEEGSRFRWVDVERPGAEQYVKGYIAYYAAMGIDHLRIDFMSWFENGFDRNLGRVGPERPRAQYDTALRWMREAADRHGVQLSVAMTHLNEEGEIERRHAHSVRVNPDVDTGGWWNFSARDRGQRIRTWSQWANAVDGFTYWSRLTGRDRVRLDGDFLRMNTYASAVERRSVMSMHLLAGGPIAVADRYDTIGDAIDVYRNDEMLALNRDGFVGRPLSDDPTNETSQVWTGRLSNGDTVVALFNRESTPRTWSVSFADLGVAGEAAVRDLWQRAPLGTMSGISVELAPHAALVLKVTPGAAGCRPQSVRIEGIADTVAGDPGPTLSASSTSGLPVRFEVALGPARVDGDRARPTGEPGLAYVVATQPGDATWCAAVPVVKQFAVFGGR